MRQRQKNVGLWIVVWALVAMAMSSACSAIGDNDKTKNPRLPTYSGGSTTGGAATATGAVGPITGGTQ